MSSYAVWAPTPDLVELALGGQRHPMTRGDDDWWRIDVEGEGDYAFALDGGEPRPDPRSAWQPHGVNGPSRLVDHEAFGWTDQHWRGLQLAGSVLYELHIGTFTEPGTFDGAIARLDHLVELGVDAVELLPCNAFAGERGWGYDGVAWFAVHEPYGGPEGLKRFVDACHVRGLGVVMDVVYNHLGPAGNYLPEFGPYLTDAHTTPWGSAVNLDRSGSDEVRAYILDNVRMWLRDYHVDGLRLDAVHAIIDTSAVHLLEQLAAEVEELSSVVGRPLFLIAESDLNDPRLLRPRSAGGYGLDAQWSDDFHHSIRTALTDERRSYYVDFDGLPDVAATLERGWPHAGGWSAFRGRTHGRPFDDLPGWQLLGYAQDHDQVGNRA
ncbi:MAG: malto-oligosyltrehalose trehalohydrolase, partial [Mycobacteriales bacterium]